jgi:hypothetical protein
MLCGLNGRNMTPRGSFSLADHGWRTSGRTDTPPKGVSVSESCPCSSPVRVRVLISFFLWAARTLPATGYCGRVFLLQRTTAALTENGRFGIDSPSLCRKGVILGRLSCQEMILKRLVSTRSHSCDLHKPQLTHPQESGTPNSPTHG